MESKLRKDIQEGLKEIKAPESLYDFANRVPDIAISMNLENPIRSKRNNSTKKSIFVAISVLACSFLLMFGVINTTSFANYVDKIPVLSQLSKLLKVDSGVEKAVDNGFLQEVSKSAEDQGITFTIDNVIGDSKRTFVFFNIKLDRNRSNIDEVNFVNFKVSEEPSSKTKDRKDSKLLSRHVSIDRVDHTKLTGWMEIIGVEPTTSISKKINLSIGSFIVTKSNKIETIEGKWDISFANNMKSKPIEYKGDNFSINVGPRKLNLSVNYTKVYPTITEMSIELQTEIKEGILYEYHLENENGKIYKHISDGVLTDTGDTLPQFESSYFDHPQKLFLVIDKVRISRGLEGTEETFEINEKIELTK